MRNRTLCLLKLLNKKILVTKHLAHISEDFQALECEIRYQYCFYGQIYPSSADAFLHPEKTRISYSNSNAGETTTGLLELKAFNGFCEIKFMCADPVNNLETLRNVVRTFVRQRLSLVSFYQGFGFGFEIDSVTIMPTGESFKFTNQIKSIKSLASNSPPVSWDLVFRRAYTEEQMLMTMHARISIDDFSRAVADANQTPFYCRRAIDSILNYYIIVNGADPEDTSRKTYWEKMRKDLNVEHLKNDMLRMSTMANPLRHGQSRFNTEEDNKLSLDTTWKILNAFFTKVQVSKIEYLKSQNVKVVFKSLD